jgi:hypothetical protein
MGIHDAGEMDGLELVDGERAGDILAERLDVHLVTGVGRPRLVGLRPIEEGIEQLDHELAGCEARLQRPLRLAGHEFVIEAIRLVAVGVELDLLLADLNIPAIAGIPPECFGSLLLRATHLHPSGNRR